MSGRAFRCNRSGTGSIRAGSTRATGPSLSTRTTRAAGAATIALTHLPAGAARATLSTRAAARALSAAYISQTISHFT